MQENQQNIKRYEEDEIDLRELFRTLMKNKVKIVVITSVITILAIVYVLLKNPIPIYSGTVMIEVGEAKSGDSELIYFDNTNNLKSIIEQKFSASVDIPKRTNNILIVSSSSSNKEKIKTDLKSTVDYVIDKHKGKLNLYDKYIMTKQIGDIIINDVPINKVKKKLIVTVAFITGLILSIFLVFFMEFVRGFKEEEN